MSEERFGAGIALDKSFDFSVSSTGDLESVDGSEELQKDLAFQMSVSLEQFVGAPPSSNVKAKVKNTAKRVANLDSRISHVQDGSMNVEWSRNREELTLSMTVVATNDENYNLVFEV